MPNPVVHFEIGCQDLPATQTFYTKMFDWTINPMPGAAMVDTGGPGGIQGHISSLGHEPHQYTIFYVQVDDIQAAIDKAQSLGGKMLVPPVTIPIGTFAWIADPGGNTIGLWKPAAPAS